MANENEPVKLAIVQLKSVAEKLDIATLTGMADQASENLLAMLQQPEGPFKNDPDLALKVFVELSKAENAALEARRRTVDTLIKAKAILDPPAIPAPNTAPAAPQIEGQADSVFA